ncbi:ABC transporter permease subunit [Alkalimonas sp.]|uniref:ABC transporter permease subunit n=1 Tax=Alkalimonas sp. TaxID=1872453 RepID=UPI00263A972D|nr:ABC transporter permease subunit [Alkalimonas sp.]MCC5825681.1 ABC transporter permease subunit [Alkalimonas sp.]
MHLPVWSHIWLLSQIEWQRLFLSRRGWLTLAAFCLLWFLLLRYLVMPLSQWMLDPAIVEGAEMVAGWVDVRQLLLWPRPELSLFWLLALLLTPAAAVLFSAGQICRDRSRGTLRFYSLRVGRDSILLGRFFGQLLVQGTLLLLALLACLLLAFWQGASLSGNLLSAMLFCWLFVMLSLLPFTALMSLMSVWLNSSRAAVSMAVLLLTLLPLLLGILAYYWPQALPAFAWLPGAQIPALINSSPWQPWAELGLPVGQAALLLTLSLLSFRRRAL